MVNALTKIYADLSDEQLEKAIREMFEYEDRGQYPQSGTQFDAIVLQVLEMMPTPRSQALLPVQISLLHEFAKRRLA